MNPIIFLRTAWMIEYQGVTKNDKPNGAGSFVKENQNGGEVCNFLNINSKYYGFARVRKGNNLRIERLGANKNEDYIDNVIVVFFATNPITGGQFVVGWYDNARLYRQVQPLQKNQRKGHPFYLAVATEGNQKLIKVTDRKFEIPDDGPGQTNVWYVTEYKKAEQFLRQFFLYKANPLAYKYRKQKPLPKSKGGRGWLIDAEKRKRIEVAAMSATKDYFETRGYLVKYVHNEKLGWDIEVQKGKNILLLEVKGTSNSIATVILTPNEYKHSKLKSNFRVCILENALNINSRMLHICKLSQDKKIWYSDLGYEFNILEIKSAVLSRE